MAPLARTLFSVLGIGAANTDADLKEIAGRRRALRFQTELAIQWPGGGTGVVRDVSSIGLRFETNHPISVDENMKFTIVVPDDAGQKSYHTLCDSEIHWTAPSPTLLYKLSVGASFNVIKSIMVHRAA